MKRFVSLFLSLILLLSCASAMADVLAVQPAPDLTKVEVILDPANPLKIQFEGLFETQGTMSDGSIRSLYQYLPATLGYRQPLVAITMPSDADPATFLAESNWQAIADERGITIVLAQAGEGGWKADESEYMGFVFEYMDDRAYYICQDAAFYMVGYGDGANAMMTEVVTNADLYAGAAVFGLDNFDTAILETMANTESAKAGMMQSEVDLPVWIGASEKTASVEALIAYWKNANECADVPMSNAYADEIYAYPDYLANTHEITYAHVSRVMVTIGIEDVLAADFVEYMYDEFLQRVRRQDSGDVNALRWFATNEELGMVAQNLVVDGTTREFYIYVPTKYRGNNETKLPLVVAFHGGGGSGEEFGTRTSWYKVAEERGFICVFPTGSRRYVSIQANSFTPRSGWADSDVAFFKAIYDFMIAEYPVDVSRVYTTGQSQGSGMSQNVAAAYPELLAAATACSTFSDFSKISYLSEKAVLPMFWSIGAKDKYGPYSEARNAQIIELMQYWYDRYNIDGVENKYSYVNGDMMIDQYTTDNGVPMIRFMWYMDKVHANIPDECYAFYDYMIQFSRGEDGTLYYMGKPVVIAD